MDALVALLLLGAVAASIYFVYESRSGVESITVNRSPAEIISLALGQVPGGTPVPGSGAGQCSARQSGGCRATGGGRAMSRQVLVRILTALAAIMLCGLSPAAAWADANDTPAGASGPLLHGDFWSGSISTENDVDWFVLYSGASTELGVHLNGQGPDDCFGQVVELTDGDGQFLSGYGYPINASETQHILYTVGIGTFYVKVSPYNVAPCIGSNAKYGLWVTASPQLLTAPPYVLPPPASTTTKPIHSGGNSGPSASCRYARGRATALSRALRRARSASDRRRIGRNLRTAQSHVRSFC